MLTELLVAAGISSVVFAGVATLLFVAGNSLSMVDSYCQMERQVRQALHHVARDVREASTANCPSNNELALTVQGQQVSYVYIPQEGKFTRVVNGSQKVLIEQCKTIQFTLYQKNDSKDGFDEFPLASANGKLVLIRWEVGRPHRAVGELKRSVQSAKLVLRNG